LQKYLEQVCSPESPSAKSLTRFDIRKMPGTLIPETLNFNLRSLIGPLEVCGDNEPFKPSLIQEDLEGKNF